MSVYLSLKLKMKGQDVDQAPYVLSLCTTPARELADEVSFEWNAKDTETEYKYWTVMSLDKLHEIQNIYKQKIDNMEKNIVKYSAEASTYREMLPKATNHENFELIEQRINDAEDMVSWAKEEKEIAEYRYYDFCYLERMLEDNEDFELVYYIG